MRPVSSCGTHSYCDEERAGHTLLPLLLAVLGDVLYLRETILEPAEREPTLRELCALTFCFRPSQKAHPCKVPSTLCSMEKLQPPCSCCTAL